MLPLCNFYWFRIDTKHMTKPWLDQALMDSAYKSARVQICFSLNFKRRPFNKIKFNLYEALNLTASTWLHRLVLSIELGTEQTRTGKVDPARKFKCTPAAREEVVNYKNDNLHINLASLQHLIKNIITKT